MNWSPLKGFLSKYVINQFVSQREYTSSLLQKPRKLTDFTLCLQSGTTESIINIYKEFHASYIKFLKFAFYRLSETRIW